MGGKNVEAEEELSVGGCRSVEVLLRGGVVVGVDVWGVGVDDVGEVSLVTVD